MGLVLNASTALLHSAPGDTAVCDAKNDSNHTFKKWYELH
jgi:hypothetical protein